MIKEEEVIINGHSSNYLYYRNLGYNVQVRKPFTVKTKDLMRGSYIKITTICDICSGTSKNAFKDYYNYTHGLQTEFFCAKCKHMKSEKTCLDKYGVKNPMQVESVREILKKSLFDKYGVDHYSKTDDYKIKFKETCLEKWGVTSPLSNYDIKDRIKKTNNEKYGVDYPMQSSLVSYKSKITCLEKYGVDRFSKTDELKDEREKQTLKKFSDILTDDYTIISYKKNDFIINHKYCGSEFIISRILVSSRLIQKSCICTICNPIGNSYSSIETEIIRILDENNIKYLHGDRKILSGSEIDIYLPDFKIGIEVNGLYWHSELFKDKNYHLIKTKKCIDLGIDLIHIWEDDWRDKKDIVKSIILNKLSLINNKIFARNCNIEYVNSKDARTFLDKNHIQGFSSSSKRIGLYHKGELVSLMTFGFRYTNGKKEYELIRFCNKINYSVIGSASRLFKNFIKDNEIDELISYSDISIFNGNVYDMLKFKKISLSKPNYFWVVDGVRKHRFNYSKKKLVSRGFSIDKTEVEIMHDNGHYRIFSCGQEKWIYNK